MTQDFSFQDISVDLQARLLMSRKGVSHPVPLTGGMAGRIIKFHSGHNYVLPVDFHLK